MTRTRFKENKLKKDVTGKDQRVSVCIDCGWGIFTDHDYTWSNRGLVHNDCKNRKGNG